MGELPGFFSARGWPFFRTDIDRRNLTQSVAFEHIHERGKANMQGSWLARSWKSVAGCLLTLLVAGSLLVPMHTTAQTNTGRCMLDGLTQDDYYRRIASSNYTSVQQYINFQRRVINPATNQPYCSESVISQARAAALAANQQILKDFDPDSTDPGKMDRIKTVPGAINEGCGFLENYSFGRCFWAPLFDWLGATFLWFGGTLLSFAGKLFNLLVTHIIVQFGTTIQKLQLIDGIHSAWSVLRDLSNIVIIGMFTFIAISIIIGNHTFGEKKLVAKVLVVAVLINFSLLFAKIIIDSSNFIAYQVYKSMGSSLGSEDSNIAGKFLAATGVTSSYSGTLTNFSKGTDAVNSARGTSNDTAWGNFTKAAQGFFQGFIGGIMLLFAAGVLLYGSYLIIVRAILLIFLMLVSALAFATYLVPQLSGGEYGWSTWWKSLINASIFGPLLMLLLYVSLVVITKMPNASQSAADSWIPIFSLMIGIGMLLVSFKVANSFSQKIAGMPSSIPNLVNPFAPLVGTSRLLGLMGRSTFGRFADRRQAVVQEAITARGEKGPRWTQSVASSLYGAIAKRQFDALKTKTGTGLVSKLGGPTLGEKWGEGGYRGVKERQAKRAVHSAEANTESEASAKKRYEDAERDKIREEMLKNIRGMREDIKSGKGGAAGGAQMTEEARDVLRAEVRQAARVDGATRGGSGGGVSTDAVNREAASQHAASEARTRMSADAAHIAQNAAEAATAASEATKQAGLSLQDTGARLADLDAQEKKLLDKSYKFTPAEEARIKAAGTIGGHTAHEATNAFAKSVAWWTPGTILGDDKAAKKTASVFEKEHSQASLKKAIQLIAEQKDDHGSDHKPEQHKPAKVEVVNNKDNPVATKTADPHH